MSEISEIEKKRKAVAEALGKPIAAGLDDEAKKVRRNLLAVSFICLCVSFLGVSISADSTFVGIKLINLKPSHIRIALGSLAAYFLFHFIWQAWESYGEWCLRLTGTRLAFTTGSTWGNEACDYPNDPKQSTLYNWWLNQSKIFQDSDDACGFSDIKKTIQELNSSITNNSVVGINFDKELKLAFAQLIGKLNSIESNNKKMLEVIESHRISVSLKKFDERYKLMLESQNLRWLFVDVGLPIILGFIALFSFFVC